MSLFDRVTAGLRPSPLHRAACDGAVDPVAAVPDKDLYLTVRCHDVKHELPLVVRVPQFVHKHGTRRLLCSRARQ